MEDEELQRQAKLLESLEGLESFRLWRNEVITPILDQLDAKLANSDTMSEAVVRANVLLRYLVKDTFYQVFERVKVANQQEKETSNR